MNYVQIIQREFAAKVGVDASAVHVDMSDETIIVDCDCTTYECDCDDDENFVFVSDSDVVTFAIPADWRALSNATFRIVRFDVDGHDENAGVLPDTYSSFADAMRAAQRIAHAECDTREVEVDYERAMVMIEDDVTLVITTSEKEF